MMSKSQFTNFIAYCFVLLIAACLSFPSLGKCQTVTEFSYGISSNSSPYAITAGPDGNIWFTERHGESIGKITPTGFVKQYYVHLNANLAGITAGPDGNIWFTETFKDIIGRITPLGVVTEFSMGLTPDSGPDGITNGPDGNLWFTEPFGNRIGRITPLGVVTEFSVGISPNSGPNKITCGPDGNLWFTENVGNRIGRITPLGVVTEFSVGITPNSGPSGITTGPDGNIWFTERTGNRIGYVSPSGIITEFSAGITPNSGPNGIAVGTDGNIWFTEADGNRIGRVSEISTGCMATLDENLILHIPYISNSDPKSGATSIWADFVYKLNPAYQSLIPFMLTTYGIINNPSFSCTPSTLSENLSIHIPDVLLPDHSTHLWLDLEYSPSLSVYGGTYWNVKNYGTVTK